MALGRMEFPANPTQERTENQGWQGCGEIRHLIMEIYLEISNCQFDYGDNLSNVLGPINLNAIDKSNLVC